VSVGAGAWLVWLAAFLCAETVALIRKGVPWRPDMVELFLWVVQLAGWWHAAARAALAGALVWLIVHYP
jgi:hypothetical protein